MKRESYVAVFALALCCAGLFGQTVASSLEGAVVDPELAATFMFALADGRLTIRLTTQRAHGAQTAVLQDAAVSHISSKKLFHCITK